MLILMIQILKGYMGIYVKKGSKGVKGLSVVGGAAANHSYWLCHTVHHSPQLRLHISQSTVHNGSFGFYAT